MASSKYRPKIIEIYASSEDEAKKIREAADSAGLTTSKFVLNSVLPHIYKKGDEVPRYSLVEETSQLREEVRRLKEDSRARDILLERYEAELRKVRDNAFLSPSGEAALDPELLQILRKGPIHEHRLLDALKISNDNGKAIRAISRQLSFLEASGFIAKGPNGWRWLG
jgi:AmiR/NasT family two-component response regulator